MTRSLALRLCALIQAVFLLTAGLAQAHAVLQSTTPADNALLSAAPGAALLTFNEAVAPLVIRLVAPDGTETDLTGAVQGAQELRVGLPDLGQGTHVLSWRVASDDGHPIAGALIFSVGAVTGAAANAPEPDTAVRAAIWLARVLMASGLVLGLGAAVFAALTPAAPAARRTITLGAVTGLIAAPAYLGLHGLDALGLGFAALATPAPWAAAWSTSFGPSIAMAVCAALLSLGTRRFRWLAWPALVLLALSYAASGHAGAAEPRWLTRPLVFGHLVALTFWIGALIPLALSLRKGGEGLARFSAIIPFALIVLMLSGAGLALVQLGPDPAEWPSPYGYILAAKLGLLAVVFLIAAVNRWRLTGPALRGNAAARRQMRLAILAELVLAVVILGLTAGWRFTPPPRAMAVAVAPPATPAYAHLHSEKVMANLVVTPGHSGPTAIEVQLTDGEMNPIGVVGLSLGLSRPEMGIERLTRQAEPMAETIGLWHIPELVLPLSGPWQVQLDIRLSRYEQLRLTGEIEIR